MKVAIMQPYFLPYIGYFQLLNYVDLWIVFDNIQYIDKGWINRNRILHPEHKKEWQYITIPLDSRKQFSKINDIKIKQEIDWRKIILGKLTLYKKKSRFYNEVFSFINNVFNTNENNLSEFVTRSIRYTADYLGIKTKILVLSNMELPLTNINHPGDWALRICESIGAKEYINPFAGKDLFNNKKFKDSNIKLNFLKSKMVVYDQKRHEFIPGLSILDSMMWNSKSQLSKFINEDFDLVLP